MSADRERIEAALARLTGYTRHVQVDLQPWMDAKDSDDDQGKDQVKL